MGFSWPHQGTNPSLLTAMGLTWWVEFKTWVMGEASEECSTPKKPKNVVETSLVSQCRATSQNLRTQESAEAEPGLQRIKSDLPGQFKALPQASDRSRASHSQTHTGPGQAGPGAAKQEWDPNQDHAQAQEDHQWVFKQSPTAECYTIHMQPLDSQDIKFLFLIWFLWVYILSFQWGWAVMLIIGFSCVSLLYIAIRGYWQ